MAENLELYNSAYTGAQIDEVVGAVRENKDAWSGKQDALTGTQGQLVGFDANGKPVAEDGPYQKAVAAGYTGTEAEFYAALVSLKDGPFLPLSGGTMTGYLNFDESYGIGKAEYIHSGDFMLINPQSADDGAWCQSGGSIKDSDGIPIAQIIEFYGNFGDEPVIFRNLANPVIGGDATPKSYVDESIQTAIGDAIGGSY